MKDAETHRSAIALWVVTWSGASGVETIRLAGPWTDVTGQQQSETHGRGWFEALHPDDRGDVEATLQAAFASVSSFQAEARLRRADGTFQYVIIAGSPRFDETGNFNGHVGTIIGKSERGSAVDTVRISDEKYRAVFDAIDDAVVMFEVIVDPRGQPVDLRIIQANTISARRLGKMPPPGRFVSEIFPAVADGWIAVFGSVAATGESTRFDQCDVTNGRWFDIFVTRVGGHGSREVAAVFSEITARKAAESALQASEEQKSFLLRLSDALAPLADPVAIQARACRVLGEHLGVSRVYYTEVDENGLNVAGPQYLDGVAPIEPVWHSSDFGNSLIDRYRRGETVFCGDTRIDPNLTDLQKELYAREDIVSWAAVPLAKPGLPLGRLILNHRMPRQWTAAELVLIRETAERVWPTVQRAGAEAALREKEKELRRAQAVSKTGSWRYDVQANRLDWSDEACEIFGLPPGTVGTYQAYLNLVHPQDRGWVDAPIEDLPKGRPFDVEYRLVLDGATRWVRERGEFEYAKDGRPLVGFGTIQNITDIKEADQARRDSEARFRAFFENISIGASQVDRDCRLVEVNQRYCEIVGYSREQLVGKMTTADLSVRENLETDKEPIRRLLRREIPSYVAEKLIARGDGNKVWVRISAAPILDNRGDVKMIASLLSDITEQKRSEELLKDSEARLRQLNADLEAKVSERTAELAAMNETLSRLARSDPLTKLPNRLSANERLRIEFVSMKRTRNPYSILMIDLDHFKSVNDRFGHAVGDRVLQTVARTAEGAIRASDFICRFGGEEFLVLLPGTDIAGARYVAMKIRNAVAAVEDEAAGCVTLSIGIAVASPDDADEDLAIRQADELLYDAKQAGRNCVVVERSSRI